MTVLRPAPLLLALALAFAAGCRASAPAAPPAPGEVGLTPTEALAAATSAPADAFRLTDRGRIRPGLRADLLLVNGDPTRDITDTRGIVAVWKEGVRLSREPAPRVAVARRLELIGIILRLADDGKFPFLPQQQLQPYVAEIDRHFGPFRDHPAVASVRELRDTQGFDYEGAIRLALSLSEPPELRERVPLDGPAADRDRRWRTPATRRFVEELRRFAEDSRADAFFDAHQALYDSAATRLQRLVDPRLELAWFEPFFGMPAPGELVIAPMLVMSRLLHGMRVEPAGAPAERWIIVQHAVADSAGVPTYPDENVPMLAHEVIHPFVDLVGAYADSAAFARSGSRLWDAAASRVQREIYPDWRALIDDALTRAATARYVLATEGPAAARAQVAWDAARGFVWNEELFDLLGEYEARRGDYPTLAAFRPRLVAYFDSLPARVPALAERFDATRPRVVGLSIENGSESVDPAATEIVVRFDQPMRLTGRCAFPVPGRTELLPRITGCGLDSTRTALHVGVALEPGRAYEFALNPGTITRVQSADGIPLAAYPVRFRTREAGGTGAVATPLTAGAQTTSLSAQVREFVTVSEPVVALTGVTVIDGTGAVPRADQTIVIRDGRIAEVGPSAGVQVPQGARRMELRGSTVIPGLVGMHNHLFIRGVGGRRVHLGFSAPRLYLASGTTTIRTAGSTVPYAEINTRNDIERGEMPGPRIHLTAPYATGGSRTSDREMAFLDSPEAARRFVAYWASEGATWIKASFEIRRAELQAVIDEAHRRGVKVTGHLCAVTVGEAVELGIDNLEHGFTILSELDPQKRPDACAPFSGPRVGTTADPTGEGARAVMRSMIENRVGLTSTLAVFESLIPRRPIGDPRVLEAMAPEVRQAYLARRAQIDTSTSWPYNPAVVRNSMIFERAFVEAGGLLAAGADPSGIGTLPGFADQRNYELLVDAGFTAAQAVQIMTANGAKILGVDDQLGSIEPGKRADLVVLDGDLAADPSVISRVSTVFKDGVGYDSAALFASVKGQVGIR